jgi:two-component system sensor histidine kinase UhpB
VECQVAPEADALRPAVAEAIWRVAQEALLNAERHAQARHLELTVDVPPGQVLIQVRDDGVGLKRQALDLPGHYGVRGMRERVEGLGGTLTLAAPADQPGTLVEAQLPLILEPHPVAAEQPGL